MPWRTLSTSRWVGLSKSHRCQSWRVATSCLTHTPGRGSAASLRSVRRVRRCGGRCRHRSVPDPPHAMLHGLFSDAGHPAWLVLRRKPLLRGLSSDVVDPVVQGGTVTLGSKLLLRRKTGGQGALDETTTSHSHSLSQSRLFLSLTGPGLGLCHIVCVLGLCWRLHAAQLVLASTSA